MTKATVLFAPVSATGLIEMVPIARQLASDGRLHPAFFLPAVSGIRPEHYDLLTAENLAIIHLVAHATLVQDAQPPQVSLRRQRVKLRRLLPLGLRQMVANFRDYYRKRIEAEKWIERAGIVALVVMGDRHLGWETALVRAANRRGVPSLIVPYAFSHPDGGRVLRMNRSDFKRTHGMQPFVNRVVARLFPQWVMDFDGQRLLFWPVTQALPAWILGMMPKTPWALGGGAATLMATDCEHTKRLLSAQGVPLGKLVVTGMASSDRLYAAMANGNRANVRAQLGIDGSARIILFAVPALAEQRALSWEAHLAQVEYLLETFQVLEDVTVVMSLHPKSAPAHYRALSAQYGATIAEQRAYELIPVCDLFVSTYSSLVHYARAAGKPIVVVGFHRPDPLFESMPDIAVVRAPEQLLRVLKRGLRNEQRMTSDKVQEPIGGMRVLVDGLCTRRLANTIYGLIDETSAAGRLSEK